MNTAHQIYNYENSAGENPDYLIPTRIPLLENDGSGAYRSSPDDKLSSGPEDKSLEIPRIAIASPYQTPLRGKFKLLQLWEGRVIEVRDSEFDAIITNKTNKNFSDELVTLDIDEVTPDDISLIKKGAIFYWSIGYLDYPGRGRTRESKIRLRRLKGWSTEEIDSAKKVGKQFAEFFKSNPV